MIKALLLDFDDTLIKTFETKKEAMKEVARLHYHVELSDSQIKQHWGKPMEVLLTALFPSASNTQEIISQYEALRPNYPTTVYPQTLEVLSQLAEKYALGIITSKRKPYLEADLELTRIPKELFFLIQTAEDTPTHKPDPEVFKPALDTLATRSIDKSEILYVGDTLLDYFAARDAGLHFYGLADRTTSKAEFNQEGAQTINELADLLALGKL